MHPRSRVILLTVTATAAIGAALVPATTAGAAAPSITVSWPSQRVGAFNLQNGDVVTVSGKGFPASVPVFVSECSTLTGGQADCDSTPADGGVATGQTDANGAFTLSNFVFRTETLGSASCTAGTTCHAVATTNPTAPDVTTNTASADLPVDRLQVSPRSGLKNGQAVNITGGGYSPATTVYVSECTSADPAQATKKCDFKSIKTVQTGPNGTFATTTYPVHTGTVGGDGSTCNPGGNCIIAASDNVQDPANGHVGAALVKFAALKPLTVTARSSVAHIGKGKPFKVTGRAVSGSAGVSGLTAGLIKIVNGSLQKVATASTGAGGAVVFKLSQSSTTTYKVLIAAQKGYKSASSKTFKVATP